MRTRRPPRWQVRAARRRQFWQAGVDSAPTMLIKVGRAADYVRALLATADERDRDEVGEQAVRMLLSVAHVLESKTREGARR